MVDIVSESETIPALLKHLRDSRGVSDRQLAAYLGVSTTALDRWIKDRGTPDPPYVWKIAELAHMPIEDVMRLAGHLPPLPASDSPAEAQRPGERRLAAIAADMDDDGLDLVVDLATDVLKRHPRNGE